MFEVVFLNTMEFVFLAMFFAYIGRMAEFLVSAGILVSLRPFSGGFHFKKFRYCFILTFAVFALVILVLPDISNTSGLMEALLLVSILLTVVLAPVSKRNVAHTTRNNFKFKIVSAVIMLAYSAWMITVRDNPYVSIVAWMLFLQSIQLIIGKVMILHARTKVQQPIS